MQEREKARPNWKHVEAYRTALERFERLAVAAGYVEGSPVPAGRPLVTLHRLIVDAWGDMEDARDRFPSGGLGLSDPIVNIKGESERVGLAMAWSDNVVAGIFRRWGFRMRLVAILDPATGQDTDERRFRLAPPPLSADTFGAELPSILADEHAAIRAALELLRLDVAEAPRSRFPEIKPLARLGPVELYSDGFYHDTKTGEFGRMDDPEKTFAIEYASAPREGVYLKDMIKRNPIMHGSRFDRMNFPDAVKRHLKPAGKGQPFNKRT
jgi:hypothetical protein